MLLEQSGMLTEGEESNMEYIFGIVKKYADKYDFYDLLALGAPHDEYDNESRRISGLISCDSSPAEIASAIYKVMYRVFGDISDNCSMRPDTFLGIAGKICNEVRV